MITPPPFGVWYCTVRNTFLRIGFASFLPLGQDPEAINSHYVPTENSNRDDQTTRCGSSELGQGGDHDLQVFDTRDRPTVRGVQLFVIMLQTTVASRSRGVSTDGAPLVFSSHTRRPASRSCFSSCKVCVIHPHGIWNCFKGPVTTEYRRPTSSYLWCIQIGAGSGQQCDCAGSCSPCMPFRQHFRSFARIWNRTSRTRLCPTLESLMRFELSHTHSTPVIKTKLRVGKNFHFSSICNYSWASSLYDLVMGLRTRKKCAASTTLLNATCNLSMFQHPIMISFFRVCLDRRFANDFFI